MSDPLETTIAAYVDTHGERFERDLVELLRIPSISTLNDPYHRDAIDAAVAWLRHHLAHLGCEVEVTTAGGNPIVLARRNAPPGAPRVLVYGHYDVQPEDPADGWQTPAFEPSRRRGRLYARGATDDKGQLHMHLEALATLLATCGESPLAVTFLFEGEEEIGSPSLGRFVRERAADLGCDAVLISDSEMWDRDTPALELGFRGIAAVELTVQGPRTDLHSGLYGGAVLNPANVLCRLIGSLQNAAGRITLPGFYDAVRPAPAAEVASMGALPFDEATFLGDAGAACADGEAGFSTLERIWYRPSLDVHGLTAGWSGEGGKTIIPANASAKLSFRLVPDQDPDLVIRTLHHHLHRLLPGGATLDLTTLSTARPWTTDPGQPLFGAARRALRRVFANDAVLLRGGGSLPIVPLFEEVLGAPVLLLGFGLPGSNAHAPDEWLDLAVYRQGIVALALLYRELARTLHSTA